MADPVLTGFGAVSAREALGVISRTRGMPMPAGADGLLSVMALRVAGLESIVAGGDCPGRLSYIRPAGGELRIGSLTTRSQLRGSALIAAHCRPLLLAVHAQPAQGPGASATIGAAVCKPGTCTGITRALMKLGAGVVVRSRGDQRIIPVSEFRQGSGQAAGRLVTEIRIPLRPSAGR